MAQTSNQTGIFVGYFDNNADARQAVEALHDAGFSSAHLGIAHRGVSSTTSEYSPDTEESRSSTDTSETALHHAAVETSARTQDKGTGTWDKIKNLFGGNQAEPYADERSQGDLANREITPNPANSTLFESQHDYNQYDTSDIHTSLHQGLSVPEDRSRYFGHRFNAGEDGAIVTVNAGDRSTEAEEILARFGADFGDNAAEYDYNQAGSQIAAEDADPEARNNIQLLGEVLRVHKDRISRGEVRLRKEIITETQTVQVPVTREELVIERHAVNQNTQAAGSIGESQEIRIPLTEERASIDTSTVVREEVSVGKKPVEEVRDLTGEVRHEELVVNDNTKRIA